jgi:hypothetical protein
MARLAGWPGSNSPPVTPAPGDFNGDSRVDIIDYSLFLPQFNQSNGNFKLVGTGLVNLFDFSKLLSLLGY